MIDLPADECVRYEASSYWIAVAMVDESGKDPEWVRHVMKVKTGLDIDLDEARQWLAENGQRCRCRRCTGHVPGDIQQPRKKAKVDDQYSLF